MSILKNALKAAGALKNSFKGANGFGNSLMNAAQTAQASENVSIIRSKLKNAKNETEKKQLEKELSNAQELLNHHLGLMNMDAEANSQSRDRLRRIIGTDTERSKHLFREKVETDCPLKNKGDRFELQVGRHLENEGCFVFYNGMLRNEADQGVDLVAYDKREKVARYIQCKNWETKTLDYDDIIEILRKMARTRISPTTIEIKRQQQEGWSIGNQFDDSVFYKTEYCLVVPKRSSITPGADKKVGAGFVYMPNTVGNPIVLELFCYNHNNLETWLYFD
jgi:Holliday junction resolvase